MRYVNATDFDYNQDNILDLLKKFKLDQNFSAKFFDDNISIKPTLYNWQSSFQVANPNGTLALRFVTGKHNEKPALIWELLFQTLGNEAAKIETSSHFESWLKEAHKIIDKVFFKIIEGELETRFNNG